MKAEEVQKFHFIGIGGTGMSGIAQICLENGFTVSGSDLRQSEVTRRLSSRGASISFPHSLNNITAEPVVVISSAIPESNEELLFARQSGLVVKKRAELLGWFMEGRTGIAVAGCHGKTTTTSMLSAVLTEAGLDPTTIVGGEASHMGGNARMGRGEFLIAEADESDGSFILMPATHAIVTNVDNDHLEHYGDLKNLQSAFEGYVLGLEGIPVLCVEDEFLKGLSSKRDSITYGFSPEAQYRAKNISLEGRSSSYDVWHQGRFLIRIRLGVPGEHNILNSLAAFALSHQIGIAPESIAAGLLVFGGVQRRFETVDEKDNILILDDYAHHPAEVLATLKAARALARERGGRLGVIFQPHRFSRLGHLMSEFAVAFGDADFLWLLPVYAAGEKPRAGVSSWELYIRLELERTCVEVLDSVPDIGYFKRNMQPGDVLMTMGAGDVTCLGRAGKEERL